jgi:hypothetical protein
MNSAGNQDIGQRSLPKGPLGAFYPGSDTEQPGGIYKLLTLLAGGGGYKPTNSGESMSPIEREQRRLEIEIKKKQLEELNRTDNVPGVPEMFDKLNIPKEQEEDFQVKTTTQNIRGIAVQVPTLERKKTLPASEIKDYNLLSNSHRMMKKNMEFLQEKGLEIGPGLSTRPGAVADILGQTKDSDFNTWKASVGRSFDIYRKWITGAQASYKEINWIAPNYPKATDSKEIFTQKSIDVMKDIEANSTNLLNNFSEGGYAVSKMRKGLMFSGEQIKETKVSGTTENPPQVGQMFNGEKILKVRRIK